MTKFLAVLLTLAFSSVIEYANGQVTDGNIRLKVLTKGIVDSTFIFGKWTEKGGMETHLTYLGQVTTKTNKTYRIVNSVWLWGLSCRATSRILVFNEKNQYVGDYYVTTIPDLPVRLDKGRLVFKNEVDDDCDKRVVTFVNLKNGLPKSFFRKCTGNSGDFYAFGSY